MRKSTIWPWARQRRYLQTRRRPTPADHWWEESTGSLEHAPRTLPTHQPNEYFSDHLRGYNEEVVRLQKRTRIHESLSSSIRQSCWPPNRHLLIHSTKYWHVLPGDERYGRIAWMMDNQGREEGRASPWLCTRAHGPHPSELQPQHDSEFQHQAQCWWT